MPNLLLRSNEKSCTKKHACQINWTGSDHIEMPLYKCILILSNIHKKFHFYIVLPLSNILTFFSRIYWKGIQINVTCLVSYCTVKEKRIIYNNVMFMKLPNYFDYTVHFRLNLITFNKGVLLCLNLFFSLQSAKVFFKLCIF